MQQMLEIAFNYLIIPFLAPILFFVAAVVVADELRDLISDAFMLKRGRRTE